MLLDCIRVLYMYCKGTAHVLHLQLRLLGLDICADTVVGNRMLRGISGGQKKRVTAGA